jgi:hypothetical protein
VENKKNIKEQRKKDKDKDERKNKYAKSRLMNEWLDQKKKRVKQKFEFDEV